jgi:hypothetical protein
MTSWSSRPLVLDAECGISHVWVGKIWRRCRSRGGLRGVQLLDDPEFEVKVGDVVVQYQIRQHLNLAALHCDAEAAAHYELWSL